METRKKFTILFLLLATFVLAGFSLYIGLTAQRDQSIDDSSASGWCVGSQQDCNFGGVPGVWGGGEDYCETGFKYCTQAGSGSSTTTTTGGGGGNSCGGPLSAGSCKTGGKKVGDVVAYAGGTCVCTRTTADNCSCVPTAGTECAGGAYDASNCTTTKSVGSSCTHSAGGQSGTCVSAGVYGGLLKCSCQLAPTSNTTTGSPSSCTSNSECNAGQFCNNGNCSAKYANNVDCSSNSQCLSGNCQSNKCQPAGTGPSACNSDSNCSSGQYCDDTSKTCQTRKPAGGSCLRDGYCGSGLGCYSLQCRTSPSIVCGAAAGCNVPGEGSFGGQECTKLDACANEVEANKTCADYPTFSGGESTKGRFVACSGKQNCFCPHFTGQPGTLFSSNNQNVAPKCAADSGNDSCGAVPAAGPYCGDGVMNNGEVCDYNAPGQTPSTCTEQCTTPQSSTTTTTTTSTTSTTTGPYCGDGIVNGGEQCDRNAPGETPQTCNAQCQNVTETQCLGLTSSLIGELTSGPGNFVIFTVRYTTDDPSEFDDMVLRVGNPGVGRDANTPANVLVAPDSTNYSSGTDTFTAVFVWEAVEVDGVTPTADGTYAVVVLPDGSTTEATVACQSSITIDASEPEEPNFVVVKDGVNVCEENGSSTIDYTISVTNYSPVDDAVVDFVTDEIDEDLVDLGITPSAINPAYGSYSNGVITWDGGDIGTFNPGETKTFTYTIVIPEDDVIDFNASGVDNTVTVQFDTSTEDDNTYTYDLNTPLDCIEIPNTAFGGVNSRYILLAMLFIITGLMVYRLNLAEGVSRKFLNKVADESRKGSYESRVEKSVEDNL